LRSRRLAYYLVYEKYQDAMRKERTEEKEEKEEKGKENDPKGTFKNWKVDLVRGFSIGGCTKSSLG
jgi:hypothetical protein